MFRIVDRKFRDAVERPFRLLQKNSRNGCQTFEKDIAPALIFGDDVARVLVAESVGADRDELRESWR